MSNPVLFLVTTLVGLMAIAAAIQLWWRESARTSGWLMSARGRGAICLGIAGLAGIAVVQYRLVQDFVNPPRADLLEAIRFHLNLFLLACLALLAFGAWQISRNPPKEDNGLSTAGLLLRSTIAALVVLSVEGNALQYFLSSWDDDHVAAMPPQHIAAEAYPTGKVYRKDYHFRPDTGHYFQQNIPIWEKALAEFKGKPDIHYLEVGLFEGQSAFWILENVLTAPSARLTAIDPFLDVYDARSPDNYENVFYANLKLSGDEAKANIIKGFSQTELRKLPLNSFDIIYIDGSHMRADVLEDAVLSWRLLKDGGLLMFDDYGMPADTKEERPRSAIDVFHSFFGDRFTVVHRGYQVILKKKPEPRS